MNMSSSAKRILVLCFIFILIFSHVAPFEIQTAQAAATKLYLMDSASSVNPNADEERNMTLTAGAAVVAYVKNTVAGAVTPPTAATQFTRVGAGANQVWYSNPLNAVTIASTVTFNLWAKESATTANATVTAELLRANNSGTILSVIAAVTLARAELTTTMAVQNFTKAPTSTALSAGDRLAVRVYMDDGNAVTMATGKTITVDIAGGTGGADGDSWVQTTETVTEQVATTLTISQTAASMAGTVSSGSTTTPANTTTCNSTSTCSTFSLAAAGGNIALTSVKITKTGTVADADLSNVTLWYDTTGTNGAKTQCGTAQTFSSATATFTCAPTISSGGTDYFYVNYDAKSATPTYPKGGQTVGFSIAASGDVISNANTTTGTGALAGSSTFLPNATSVTYTVNSDGGRSGDSITISGYGFGAPAAANRNSCTTATVDYGCVKFIVGGVTAVPTSDFTAWSNTSIVFLGSTTLVTEGGASAIEVRAANQADATPLTYYFYPRVTSMDITANGTGTGTCGSTPCNTITSARQTDTIRINGDHLGTTGSTITVNATAVGGTPSWNGSSTVISSSVINGGTATGNVTVVRGSDSKSSDSTSGTFTILPRVTSIDITENGAGTGTCGSPPCNSITSARKTDTIRINGDHFGATTGTTTINGINSSGSLTWTGTQISGSVIAGGTDTGNVTVTRASDATSSNGSSGTFTLLPFITGTTVCDKTTYPAWPADSAREYASGDADCPNGLKDGHVQINGVNFGSAGSIAVLLTGATQQIVGSHCSASAYTSTCAVVQVPTGILDNSYTGDISLTRTADSTSSTYSGFRVLPRIASTGPVNLKGARGDTISFTGDHLCQSGTCPTSNGSSSYATFVGGNVYSGASTWTDTSNPSVVIPGAAADGTTTIVSNTSYSANYLTYDVKFKPDVSSAVGRLPANAATGQSLNLIITGTSFNDGTDGDTFVSSSWELARNADIDTPNAAYATPEWSATTNGTTTTVNTANGTFANDDAGKTKLACGTVYKWHYRYKDNSGVTNAEWSVFSNDFTFTTTDCVPDATALTNVSEGGLTDGARIGQTITLVGTDFATPTNLDTCTAGASNGCIKIGGAGGIVVGSSSIICWNSGSGNCAGGTKISFTLPSSITNYGGATTSGLIVYQNANSDTDGLTFYVYPQITSLSVSQAAEGDTITINGNHFGTSQMTNGVTVDGATATGCSWSATSLTGCVIPDINDLNDSVTIRAYQGTGGNNALYHNSTGFIIMPKVTSISAASFSDGGYQDGTFTVNGSHFGSSQGTGNVTINGATQDGTVSWGVSSISSVGIPNGGTDSGNITVTRNDGKTSAAAAATFYIYPQITSFAAANADGDIQTGSTTISGNHFGTNGTTTNITFNGAAPSTTGTWSATSVASVDIPNAGTDSGTITVTNPQTSKASNASGTFYIYPSVTSLTVPFAFTDAAREYDGGDTDGVITLNGSHFGAAGTMTVLGSNAGTSTTGTCNPAYQATCAGIQIPAAISDSTYTGNIVLTRTADSKTSTYAGFRVLPRILTNNPTSGLLGDRIQITGNHFCETGTCLVSPNRSGSNDNVKFGSTQAADSDFVNSGASPCSGNSQAWTHTEVCINVPAATPSGSQPTLVTSNTYTSNTKAFTRSSTVPNDPTSLLQKRLGGDVTLPTGATTNQTTAVMYMTMSAPVNATLIPQVEIKAIATAFDGTSVVNGTSVSYVGTPVVGSTTVSSLTNLTNYHWRARVQNNATSETSNWVSYGGNTENPPTNPAVVDLYIDTSAPNISAVSGSGNDISETITWSTGTSSNSAINYGTSTCVSGSSSSDPASVSSHSMTINNLSPGTQYYYRVNSTDSLSNTAYDPATIASDPADCRTFTTTASVSRLIKTNDFFIFQDTSSGAPSGTSTKSYDVYVAEYNATNTKAVTLKSAYVEVSGIAVASGAYSIAVQVNSQSSIIYNLPSTGGTPAPFSVIYSVTSLNYDYPGEASASNTLYISFPSPPTSISLLNAKQSLTYHYTP